MKAILVNDDKSLRWDDVPNPIIKSDEVLVEIHAAALNRADLMQREGDYPPPAGCPEWMGLEIAGVIVEIGDEAKGGFERRQLVVSGTKKTVELKPLEWYVGSGKLVTEKYIRESEDWNSFTSKAVSKPVNRYDKMMRSFAEMAMGKKDNPWDYDYELELYKIVLECCGREFI